MPTVIDRNDVQRMLTDGAHLVDVLPEQEYETEHIAGSISIPLTELDAETASRLDRNCPVIVYCFDYQ